MVGLTAGYFISRSAIGFLEISYEEKDLSALDQVRSAPDSGARVLPIRMVDLGGVGVAPDSAGWGGNYEHNQHYFDEVLLVNPPFVDSDALLREREKLSLYCGKMAGLGYNSIAMPWFLEYLNFDRYEDGRRIYGEKSNYRLRHKTLAREFGALMQLAADSGLSTYLWTDMIALTPPLKSYFEDRFGFIDTRNPELWEVYERAAEEAFEKFPQVEGIILRIGEAGSVYNKPGWDYTSELYVRSEEAVKLMLDAFLRAAEKYDKTIVFRTWSVGVGKIGDMHTNSETYHKILDQIDSDHLLVSTKYCSGDFYSWLPFNPTLYQGEHRRLVEFQTKREFEGFGAIPNYMAPLHQSALQTFLEKNPKLEGAWVWTQYGGPLRAGPLIIYPFHGFNVINELNVYASSQVLKDPYVALDQVTASWIKGYFGSDSLLVANLSGVFNKSYEVMKKGLYISEFAKYDVRTLGLEPPPMMWIFEWNILGASSAVFSNIYHISSDHFQEVLDEGVEAVKGAIGLKELLLEAYEHVDKHHGEYEQLLASVDYQIELFRLLDYYRQFFMHYYRWVETGDPHSSGSYKLAMGQFKAMMDFHEQKYGGNLHALRMDFEETRTGISLAEQTPSAMRWAKVVVVLFLFLLILGIPGAIRDRANRRFAGTLLFDSLFRPHRVSAQNVYHGSKRLAVFLLGLYIGSLVIFSAFTSLLFPLFFGGLGLLFITTLTFLCGHGQGAVKIWISLIAYKVLVMTGIMVIVAIRGPHLFWYLLWTSDLFKGLFFTLFLMLLFRKFQVYVILSKAWKGARGSGAGALVFLVLGIQLLLAGAALWIFGLEYSLTAMNNQLLVLPGGLSKIMGITTHLGIPLQLPFWIVSLSSGVILVSFLLNFVARRRSF